jgi:hypothetical protein
MKNPNKFQIFLISFFFVCLLFFYSKYYKQVPIIYFDEQWWVWDSSMFQHLLEGDFNSEVWQARTNIDQPSLPKYIFGAWIYPKYLEAKSNGFNSDYTNYLVSQGYYYEDGILPDEKIDENFIKGEIITPENKERINNSFQRHNLHVLINPDLIYWTRFLNIFILMGAVGVLLYLLFKIKGIWFSLVFFFLYGFNPLLIRFGLMAQTEALFLLLFNSSLVALIYYFVKEEDKRLLLWFSVLVGLCFSTKLNGVIPLFTYLLISVVLLIKKIDKVKTKALLYNYIWDILFVKPSDI